MNRKSQHPISNTLIVAKQYWRFPNSKIETARGKLLGNLCDAEAQTISLAEASGRTTTTKRRRRRWHSASTSRSPATDCRGLDLPLLPRWRGIPAFRCLDLVPVRCKSWKPTDDDHTSYQQTYYQHVMNAKNKGNLTIRNLYDFLDFSAVGYKVLRTLPGPMRHGYDHLEFFAGQMADLNILHFLSAGRPAANTRHLQSKCPTSLIRSMNFNNIIMSRTSSNK